MQPISTNLRKMIKKIKQAKTTGQQAMDYNDSSLVSFTEDFGHLIQSTPGAVVSPTDVNELAALISHANQQQIPLTIRGSGLSQSGQSLATENSLIINMSAFNQIIGIENESIWVEVNISFSEIINETLKTNQIPYVIPYNTHLTLGGVISAGGVGSSSFKYGSVVDHIIGLQVITSEGLSCYLDTGSDLFHACLGGQGQFAVITKVQLKLRPCKKNIRTFFCLYLDQATWLTDLYQCQQQASYIESICTPALQGTKVTSTDRQPFAEWFYSIQVTLEYDEILPELPSNLSPWRQVHVQEEPIKNFLHRHDVRFKSMKQLGQWDLPHPWFECFVDKEQLKLHLQTILNNLPLFYATVLQVAPITKVSTRHFFMLPKAKQILTIMILPQGIPNVLVPHCLEMIKQLDELLLPLGSKRYLSGFLGITENSNYWRRHFDEKYDLWNQSKATYDSKSIFCSHLHPRKKN